MININYFRSHTLPLEIEFEEEHIREVNILEECDFDDFLCPNEKPVTGIIEHLERSQSGVIVSTGTERSFFNLLFCDDTNCEGMVIRDINPRVKAYVDFNTALIRISNTCEEYSKWSQTLSESTQICQTIEKIRGKIVKSTIPQKIKDYYLKNVVAFGEIYLRADKSWRSQENFKESFYHQNIDQFHKIKRYIEAGNFISTIGQINDLKFLIKRNVAVVNTSNIRDYSMLDIQGGENFHPRIIWTDISTVYHTRYYSYIHVPLDEKERNRFEKMLAKMRCAWRNCDNAKSYKFPHWMSLQLKKFDQGDAFNRDVGSIYSINTLLALESFMKENFLEKWPVDSYASENTWKILDIHSNRRQKKLSCSM